MSERRRQPGLPERIERLWLRALPILAGDYLFVSAHGFRFYGTMQHHLMLYRFLRPYERYTRKLFQKALEPGMRVLDIGAHIGFYTLLAARGVGRNGRVYSFECEPGNVRFLRHNVVLNGFDEVVTIVPKAAGAHSGVIDFFVDAGDSAQSSFTEGRNPRSIEVESTTVDEVVGEQRIDVIKIDVEGSEVAALRGMERMLSRAEDLVLFVECNPRALRAAGGSVADLLEPLDRHGFRVRVIHEKERSLTEDRGELFDAERAGPSKFYANLYCTKGSGARGAERGRDAA